MAVNSGKIPTDGSSLELTVPIDQMLVDAYCEMPDGTVRRSTDGVLTLRYRRNEKGYVTMVNYAVNRSLERGEVVAYLVSTRPR